MNLMQGAEAVAETAHLIAGDAPPASLLHGLAFELPGLRGHIISDGMIPKPVAQRAELLEIRDAAAKLSEALKSNVTVSFLDFARDDRLGFNPHMIACALDEIAGRASNAADTIPLGGGKKMAQPKNVDAISADVRCALIILIAGQGLATRSEAKITRQMKEACEAYWKCAGGRGRSLGSWDAHLSTAWKILETSTSDLMRGFIAAVKGAFDQNLIYLIPPELPN